MTVAQLPQTIVPNSSFRKKVEKKSGESISSCFQCEKCTNGCPLAFSMDILDEVLNSDTIWVCASCETCTTRCPNGIDIAHVMDSLRQISQSEGVKASQPQIPIFHKAFLASMKTFGRVHEGEMAAMYTLKTGGLKGLLGMAGMGLDMFRKGGLDMFRKGKVKILPHRPNKQVKDIFRAAEREGQ